MKYAVGIDLGTTNSALAYIPLKGAGDRPKIETFPIPQLIDVGEFGKQALLPSFAYIPGEHELAEGSTALPWDPKPPYLVGEAAHRQGSRVPGRMVSSAKSWLCHAGVDRKANILPWSADAEV
jgi:molecular chaperone DnaK (HSP70)